MTVTTAPAGRRVLRRPSFVPIGIVAMVAAVLAFSSSSTLVKWSETPGSVVAFWRMLISVVLWWAVIAGRRARTGRPPPSAEVWRRVLPAGLFFGFNITLFFTAIGLAIVLFLGGSQGGASLGGDLLMIVVVGMWIGYLITGRRARATVDTVDFMATMMPLGVLTATPVALLIAGKDMWPLSAKAWIAACLLGVLTGMVGHGLIAFAQREVDIATIGIIQVGQPALAVGWSYLILGEHIKGAQIPGMILVLVGLVAFILASRRRVASAPLPATVGPDQHGELTGPVG
jgi:drug/metabolite transporter, DME family